VVRRGHRIEPFSSKRAMRAPPKLGEAGIIGMLEKRRSRRSNVTPRADREARHGSAGDRAQAKQGRAALSDRIVLGLEATVGGARAERQLDIEELRTDRAERGATLGQPVADDAPLVQLAADAVFEDSAVHRAPNAIAVDREFHVPRLAAGDSL